MRYCELDGLEYVTVRRQMSPEETEKDKLKRTFYKCFIQLFQLKALKSNQSNLILKTELMLEGLDFDYILPLGGNLMLKIDSTIHLRKYWLKDGTYNPKTLGGVCLTPGEFKTLLSVTDRFAEQYLAR